MAFSVKSVTFENFCYFNSAFGPLTRQAAKPDIASKVQFRSRSSASDL
jgi:hypothetical protein